MEGWKQSWEVAVVEVQRQGRTSRLTPLAGWMAHCEATALSDLEIVLVTCKHMACTMALPSRLAGWDAASNGLCGFAPPPHECCCVVCGYKVVSTTCIPVNVNVPVKPTVLSTGATCPHGIRRPHEPARLPHQPARLL